MFLYMYNGFDAIFHNKYILYIPIMSIAFPVFPKKNILIVYSKFSVHKIFILCINVLKYLIS